MFSRFLRRLIKAREESATKEAARYLDFIGYHTESKEIIEALHRNR